MVISTGLHANRKTKTATTADLFVLKGYIKQEKGYLIRKYVHPLRAKKM